jgi:polyhydroxyalkanoate synthesis regulator phasin
MAKGKPTPQRIPDAVRDAVERTILATVGSAQQTRGRAQDAVDEIVERAEAGAESVRARVKGAIDTTRPATYEDVRELQAELRALGRRLAAIEERLPEAGTGVAKPARTKGTSPPKQSTASSKTAAARKAAAARKSGSSRKRSA